MPALDSPPPLPPDPPRYTRALTIIHVLGTALNGCVLIRGMWIDDYVVVGFMAPAFAISLYALWDVFKDRQ